MTLVPIDLNQDASESITQNFEGLYCGDGGLSSIQGGQTAGNQALANLNITGYANDRSEVLPVERRGATKLSPYIRHNIVTLEQVYQSVRQAPFKDREKFRDELFWQEFARHLYARVGVRLFENMRFQADAESLGDGWNREMLCIDQVVTELETDGWLVNQTRMWLASHWTVRNKIGWKSGQERMHQHLLDGSRAANLLGWQWTVGSGTGKPYGFAKWQVDKRAPGLCTRCSLKNNCPIAEFPEEIPLDQLVRDNIFDHDPDPATTAGPRSVVTNKKPEFVLLTIDSLGDADAAMVAHPQLPVVFVFNQTALKKLQLSSQRLGFYLQTLQDLHTRRQVLTYLGDPYQFAREHPVAVTYAPVPSFKKFADLAEIHPYPWLRQPHSGSVRSFTSWRKALT